MAALATIGVVGIVVGGVGGWRMARGEATEADAGPVVHAPAADPAVAEPPVPLVAAPPSTAIPTAAAPAAAAVVERATEPRRSAAKRTRRRPETPRKRASDDSAHLSEMFPKAMQ